MNFMFHTKRGKTMRTFPLFLRFKHIALAAGVVWVTIFPTVKAFTPSTTPGETVSVPGNLLLALSVEFPTGLQVSYTGATYNSTLSYLGYFDNSKCYSYDSTKEVFLPQSGLKTTGGGCPNANHWNGNILNWLTMTNVDQFRSVMTGGTRDNFSTMSGTYYGDDTTRTVLIRSLSDRNSNSVVKTLPAASYGVPSTYAGKMARSGGFGSKFFLSTANNFSNLTTGTQQLESCASTVARGLSNMASCFNIRVEVCEAVAAIASTSPAVSRESNCVGYANNSYYKPEGLIQGYSGKLRFGAMGYLDDNSTSPERSGGVLRAAMKAVGAKKIGEGDGVNSNNEWGTDGILVIDPNPTDSAASGVTHSGVINYLNQFGFGGGYKTYDPVGELYYGAVRYFRNMSFPADWTTGTTTAMKDGFPVITTFSDPIVKSCSKNFILGIGDIHTHCDGNVPGGINQSGLCAPDIVPTDDSSINAQTLWTSIRSMEGITATPGWVGGANQGTPYMAGIAWWSHTNDIRTDLVGKQTIATYWVDVLETNNNGGGINAKTQFWLATKYGGYKQSTVDAITVNATDPNIAPASWDVNSVGKPDSLYAGNDPVSMNAGLKAAFADIAAQSADSSASSAAVTSNRQTSSSQIVYAGYDPKVWSGSVHACSPTQSAKDTVNPLTGITTLGCEHAPLWEAAYWFDPLYVATGTQPVASPKLTNTNRKIFTSDITSGTFSAMPFQWASFTTGQQGILNSTDSQGSNRTDFLRGSRALEGSTFRTRGDAAAQINPTNTYLGDVVNSNVTYLKGSGPAYKGANYPGHSTYRAVNATRPATIYVGANDGMLHAFDASNGKELWAYVPSAVFPNLPALTSTTYTHQFYVDSTAMVADTETGVTATPWRTMLVGALGGGGRGYYALDISKQQTTATQNFSNMTEAQLATIPMWEFTSIQDSDLGYTYNEPSVDPISGAFKQITKVADATTASGVWRVVVGNGYGSAANKAALLLLNASTGAVANKLVASTTVADNGLSTPTPVDTDGDGLIDTIYAGDLLGKMHKFQFSKLVGSNYVLAASGDSAGAWRYIGVLYDASHPITAAPVVTRACSGNLGWEVLFGTGKMVENADFSDTSNNSFIAVTDNNVSSSLTVSSTDLATISLTTATSTAPVATYRTWTAPSLTGKKGWIINFTGGERIISNPTLPPDTGSVLFGTAKPSGDLCSPGSSGYLMAANICSAGIGGLTITDGTNSIVVGGLGVTASGVLKVSNTYTNNGNKQTVVCNQADCQNGHPPTIATVVAPPGRYSWRELLSR
jgi:type IV pilus assembly protein PilY1